MNIIHLASRYYTASSVAITTATLVGAAGRSLLPVIAPAARELLMTALTLLSGTGAFMANLSAGITMGEEVSMSIMPVVVLVGILVSLNGTAIYLMHRFTQSTQNKYPRLFQLLQGIYPSFLEQGSPVNGFIEEGTHI
jgi:hypothetical protein